MIVKLFRLIFQSYMEDDYGSYYHSGIGYTGVDHDPYHRKHGRIVHHGVGYAGVYDE